MVDVVPTGTVDFSATTAPRRSTRPSRSITDSTAARSACPSGALGVGTHTKTTSRSASSAKSALKRSTPPASPSPSSSDSPGSSITATPARSLPTRSGLMSTATVLRPAAATQTAVVRPT